VASRPEQQQFQPARNCFAKADAFMGQNGWVGKPKSDIWIADSQVGLKGRRVLSVGWLQPWPSHQTTPSSSFAVKLSRLCMHDIARMSICSKCLPSKHACLTKLAGVICPLLCTTA
jgi:hypothetical protein